MFGEGLFNQKSSNNFDDIMRQIQLNQYNQMNVVQPQQNQAVGEISKIMSDLTKEEQILLQQDPTFISARQTYEQTFMAFLSSKFSYEFSNNSMGQQANESLLSAIKNSLGQIKRSANEERERITQLARILQENPNILSELKDIKTIKQPIKDE